MSLVSTTRVFAFGRAYREAERAVAVERAVQVVYGDIPFGVMMMTPRDLEDFAYGFSLTEGVIETPSDIRGIALSETQEGTQLAIDLVGARLHAHLARKRALSGRTSCGLCGIEDLSALPRANARITVPPFVQLGAIEKALRALDRQQPLNAETHAVHGAAWCDFAGAIVHVREDVGRHNALDKLVGTLLRAGISPDDGFVLITSRASFEMVEKVATFGARTLVAVSAPTTLAIERARRLDLTLIGVARHDAITAFHGGGRIVTEQAPA